MQMNDIRLMLATVIPRIDPSGSPGYTSQILGSGHVRIDVSLYEIKGFGFFGLPNDQILLFPTFDLASHGSSNDVDHELNPFAFYIHKNPLE
jgi:hypothetical protein